MSPDLYCRAPHGRACANLVPIPRALKNYMDPPETVPDLPLINRAGGLYGRILTEVVSTDRTQ